jgi:hypothetical protein
MQKIDFMEEFLLKMQIFIEKMTKKSLVFSFLQFFDLFRAKLYTCIQRVLQGKLNGREKAFDKFCLALTPA